MPISRDYAVTDLLAVARDGSGWSFGPDGVLVDRGANALRPDYDPATLVFRGVPAEGGSTNYFINPRFEGTTPDVGGAGGSFHPISGKYGISSSGISSEIIGVFTGNGFPVLRMRYFGTPTVTGSTRAATQTSTIIPSVVGETWTHSVSMRVVSGVWNFTQLQVELREYLGGAGLTQAGAIVTPAASWQRFFYTRTLTDATVDNVVPTLRFAFTLGQAIDVTVDYALPQVEKVGPSSPILPQAGTPAASTRNADVITMTDIARWFQASAGTFCIDFTPGQAAAGAPRGILGIDDGTDNNRIDLYMDAATPAVQLRAVSNGNTLVPDGPAGTAVALVRSTLRMSWGPAGWFVSLDGAAPLATAIGALPLNLSRVRLGNRGGTATDYLNGWIGPRIAFYPMQYTDAPAADGFTIRNR